MDSLNNSDHRSSFYSQYSQYKKWVFGEWEAHGESYQIEFDRLQLRGALDICEIGFGSGGFLNWSQQQGHRIVGTEVNQEFYDEARSKGYTVYLSGDLKPLVQQQAQYDLVVAFDILEHLKPLEIAELLKQAFGILKPQGQLLLRFPNSVSPFSAQIQHADITHVTSLSVKSLMQIAGPLGFELRFADNAARPLNYGNRPRWQRVVLYKIRNLVEVILGNLYYGHRIPLDPNLAVILKRPS